MFMRFPRSFFDIASGASQHSDRYRLIARPLLRCDLTPGLVLFSERHRIGAFLQPFGPYREPVAVSSRPGESHPEPLTEPCLNLSIYTALVVQP